MIVLSMPEKYRTKLFFDPLCKHMKTKREVKLKRKKFLKIGKNLLDQNGRFAIFQIQN